MGGLALRAARSLVQYLAIEYNVINDDMATSDGCLYSLKYDSRESRAPKRDPHKTNCMLFQ